MMKLPTNILICTLKSIQKPSIITKVITDAHLLLIRAPFCIYSSLQIFNGHQKRIVFGSQIFRKDINISNGNSRRYIMFNGPPCPNPCPIPSPILYLFPLHKYTKLRKTNRTLHHLLK